MFMRGKFLIPSLYALFVTIRCQAAKRVYIYIYIYIYIYCVNNLAPPPNELLEIEMFLTIKLCTYAKLNCLK